MLSDGQKRKIVKFAVQRYRDNDDFHRMKHIRRVVAAAAVLARMEGGNKDVCWAASMLHDIAKHKKGNHGTIGAKEAKEFLLSIGVDRGIMDKVYDAIYFHNKGFADGPIERQIVWDADKMDSMTLDGFKNRMLKGFEAESGIRMGMKRAEKEYLFFKRRFHTKEGKRIAKENRALIEEYLAKLKARRRASP
jgi:HD superfamily phosphodiesterase